MPFEFTVYRTTIKSVEVKLHLVINIVAVIDKRLWPQINKIPQMNIQNVELFQFSLSQLSQFIFNFFFVIVELRVCYRMLLYIFFFFSLNEDVIQMGEEMRKKMHCGFIYRKYIATFS